MTAARMGLLVRTAGLSPKYVQEYVDEFGHQVGDDWFEEYFGEEENPEKALVEDYERYVGSYLGQYVRR